MRALRRQSAIGLCLSFLIGLSPAYDDVLSGKLLLAGLGDGGAAQPKLVAVSRHPFCAGQVAFERLPCAVRLALVHIAQVDDGADSVRPCGGPPGLRNEKWPYGISWVSA